MFLIPTQRQIAFWRQRTRLDGADYLLDFAWNARESAWYLSVRANDETDLVLGVKLVSNWPLFKPYRSTPGLFQGDIMVADQEGTTPQPGFNDLDAIQLVYFTADEVSGVS